MRFLTRLFLLYFVCMISFADPPGSPNFLIILADDCTFSDLPLYGGENARTPNIDRLAGQGMVFNRAYLCEAMCQPSRAALYTGLFPMRNGCAWNHSASFPAVRSMPHHLGPLGYRVGLAGKVHVSPDAAFPFEKVEGFDPNCVRNPTRPHDLEPMRQFMRRDRATPFCMVVALVEPHVPWVMGDASAYPPDDIRLPPNIADTERTRADFGRYLAEITYMDGQVGEILGLLEEENLSDQTVVLFSSEQGAQFPGCKWTNYDTGLHTAMMVRWPGRIDGGSRTDALVQWVDVLPTLIDIAGGDASSLSLDGFSFLEVLQGGRQRHRDYAFGVHNNIPEGPAYPIRSITDGRYRYIRNLLPDEIYIEKHLMGLSGDGLLNNPYWGTWVWDTLNPRTYNLVKRYIHRPAEELYDLDRDPFELENLVERADMQPLKTELARELDRWLQQQEDPGIPQDTQKALQAARQGRHLYGPIQAARGE
jgi:uncharacterized sulfatase